MKYKSLREHLKPRCDCLNSSTTVPCNENIVVDVNVKAELMKQFLEEYRNLLNKYGFATELTNNHYLVFNLCDLINVEVKPMNR